MHLGLLRYQKMPLSVCVRVLLMEPSVVWIPGLFETSSYIVVLIIN